MKKIILLLSFVGLLTCGYSQVDVKSEVIETVVSPGDDIPDSNAIFVVVEENPEFPGGDEARIKFIQENLKYPKSALENEIKGTVYVSFVVEKDGSITNIRLLRGFHPDCDAEAIRIIKLFPKWIPGKQKGKVVRVQFNMPVKFMLSEDSF